MSDYGMETSKFTYQEKIQDYTSAGKVMLTVLRTIKAKFIVIIWENRIQSIESNIVTL